MQLRFQQVSNCTSAKMLKKATSMPSFTDTNHSSSNSIEPSDEEYRKLAIRWILSFTRKIGKDTQYLAISYLCQLNTKPFCLNEDNYERIAITVLLIAAKMNEIYPPKITTLTSHAKRIISKEEVILTEGRIVAALNYEIAKENTVYSRISKIMPLTNM